MSFLKQEIIKWIEVITFLFMGLLLTLYVLIELYESFGIENLGNIWVNWFGVSYFLFVLYIVITGLLMMNSTANYFKKRLNSKFFWFLFIGSIYIIFIPFVKGENPF